MMQTDEPLPLFLRIIDADPHCRLAGRQRLETRIETFSWQWRFLLMIAIARKLTSKKSGLSVVCSKFVHQGNRGRILHLNRSANALLLRP